MKHFVAASLAIAALAGVVALAAYELDLASSVAIVARDTCGAALAIAALSRAGRRIDAIAIGIVLATIADAVLASSTGSARMFVLAMAVFAAGHASFTKGLWRRAQRGTPRAIATMLPLALYATAVLYAIWSSLGPLRVPVVIYVTMLTIMCWRALLAAQRPRESRAALAIAGLFFVLGDTALAIHKFRAPISHSKLLALAPYWMSLGAFVMTIPAPPSEASSTRAGRG
jgi:uncharacterized membrane protein YhhN